MKKATIFFLSFILFISFISSCTEDKKKVPVNLATLQSDCVHRLTEVIVYDIFSPPVASRIYAYSNLAYYEAIRFKNNATSISITAKMHGFDISKSLDKNKEYNFSLAAVKSFFNVAKALTFSKDSLATTEKKILEEFKNSTSQEVYKNSVEFGENIAGSILKRAAADNYKITRGMPKYSVFKKTGKWQQTPPEYADAIESNWGLIKPMLLDSAAQFKPVAPPAYDLNKKSNYYKELMEVYTISKQLTYLQDTIAHYWDDNPFVTQHKGHLTFATKKTTPAGHWMGIIAILCSQQKAGEIKTAAIYALTSCAIFDGFISCWDEKYRSKMVRPITVIRETLQPEWSSLLQTPPFPEYTSGHSVITTSAASVLTHQMGDGIFFTDTTELEYLGLQRSFSSIQQAADEACISRLYGGIHYRSAIEQGKKQGQQIGNLYNTILK